MKPELQEKALQYLETMEGAVTASKDFVAREAPLVVQEYLLLERIYLTGLVVFLILTAVVLLFVAKRCFGAAKRIEFKESPQLACWIISGAASAVWCFVALPAILIGNGIAHDTLAVWFAPRVFLLERLAELVK